MMKRGSIKIGKEIVNLLEQYKFQIEWDESINSRILISKIYWQKIPDDDDWSLNRPIEIMRDTLSKK